MEFEMSENCKKDDLHEQIKRAEQNLNKRRYMVLQAQNKFDWAIDEECIASRALDALIGELNSELKK